MAVMMSYGLSGAMKRLGRAELIELPRLYTYST